MLTLSQLQDAKSQVEAKQAAKPKLSDFVGKPVITALPGPCAYEATIKDLILGEDQFTLHVTTHQIKGLYSVNIRVNQFFEDQVNPLFHQLNIPSIDFEALKAAIGQQILIGAVETMKDGKIYTNYRFDMQSIKNLIPVEEPTSDLESI